MLMAILNALFMLHLTLMILRMRSYTRVTPSHVKNAPEEVRIATPSIPLR